MRCAASQTPTVLQPESSGNRKQSTWVRMLTHQEQHRDHINLHSHFGLPSLLHPHALLALTSAGVLLAVSQHLLVCFLEIVSGFRLLPDQDEAEMSICLNMH